MKIFGTEKEEESDDVNLLPIELVGVYRNPYRTFGLDENSNSTQVVRDSFRKACLPFMTKFFGLGNPKVTLRQLLLAYNILRGNVTGPASRIKKALETSPFMKFEADELLTILRPLRGKFMCPKEYRACKSLVIVFKESRVIMSYVNLPRVIFVFEVHYCLRCHKIEKEFSDFQTLHEELRTELLLLPIFPEPPFLGVDINASNGPELANYIMRVHSMLGSINKFSPRLLRFLNIDFEKVQSEEEGTMLSLLDATALPPMTAWHIIDESWLAKWRRFVMGRGPRRYLPPGPIDNSNLIEILKKSSKRDLEISIHYRCVSYNAWRYLELVHGGGPCISRKDNWIYADFGVSYLQGIIMIQNRMRIFLARKMRIHLSVLELSRSNTARTLIMEASVEDQKQQAEELIRMEQLSRVKGKLDDAISFTQSMWRRKKKYVPEENLERIKRDQEVFAKARGGMQHESGLENSVVVRDFHSIIHIGSTSIYQCVVTEQMGHLPFKTKQIPGTEEARVVHCEEGICVEDSKIVSINSYPTATLTYKQILQKLGASTWPLYLELEKPKNRSNTRSMDSIFALGDFDLQLNAFKMLLSGGMKFVKHNSGNKKYHLTTIRLTDKEFFYKSHFKSSDQKEHDLWNKFSLFNLKYIIRGQDSENILSRPLNVINPDFAFELVTEDREFILEYPMEKKLKELEAKELKLHRKRVPAVEVKDATAPTPMIVPVTNEGNSNRLSINIDGIPLGDGVFGQDGEARSESLAVDDIEPDDDDNEMLSRKKSLATLETTEMNQRVQQNNIEKLRHLYPNDTIDEEDYHRRKTKLIIALFNKIIEEVLQVQVFVDKDGIPVRRTTAKSSLRKLESRLP